MKKLSVLIALLFLIQTTFAQLVIESLTADQSITAGETFTIYASIRNAGTSSSGSSTNPIIANIISSDNCLINSAKIIGTIGPDEVKTVSWVVTAPLSGSCSITVSAGTLTQTYASQSISTAINQVSEESGSSPVSPGTGSSSNNQNSGAPGASNQSAIDIRTVEPNEEIKEEIITETPEEEEEANSESSAGTAENSQPVIYIVAAILAIISLGVFYRRSHIQKKKRKHLLQIKRSAFS